MKKWIVPCCSIIILLSLLCGCVSHPAPPLSSESDSAETQIGSVETQTSELYNKAMSILDEFDDPRIDDFREAYALLMSLPNGKDAFINQLDKINRIFEKYGVDFKYGGWYLQPYLTDDAITQDGMDGYKAKQVYWDVEDLLQAIVYPVLFDKYGNEAQHIEGITASEVIAAIEATGNYQLEETTEDYNGFSETWAYLGQPKSDYKMRYHANGLVESINIPIIRSDAPLLDDDFSDFFECELAEQKQIAGERFMSMTARLSSFSVGYDVLSQIYSDEEIAIIFSYIKSLSSEDIWEKNMWADNDTGEPSNYTAATVSFVYRGNSITINYGVNCIYLRVIGKDYVNQLSSAWYTLYCGLALPDGSDDAVAHYQNYLDYNTASNDVIYEWSFDLDAHEYEYINDEPDSSNSFVVSFTDTITVDGVIEKNIDIFPQYRLKLSVPVHITLPEYDEEFDCEYLYFYDDAELNGGYNYADLIGANCEVVASVENFRGGGQLFFVYPEVTVID